MHIGKQNVLFIISFITCFLLSIDIRITNIGPFNISTAELSILTIAMLPFFLRQRSKIEFVRNNRTLIIAVGIFLVTITLSAFYSPVKSMLPLKSLARHFAILVGIWQMAVFFHETGKYKLFTILFSLAAVLSIVSIPERFIPSFGNLLSDIFRSGTSTYINGILRPAATLGHANLFACYNVSSIFMGVVLKDQKIISERLFWIVTTVILIAVSLSSSRNSLLALSVGLFLLASNKSYRRTAVKILVLCIVTYILFSPSLKRVSEYRDEPSVARLMMWESAVKMSMDYPLLGVGPGCYNKLLIQYASDKLMEIEKENIEKQILNAHDVFFNVLAEFGFLGLLAFCFLVINILRTYFRIHAFRQDTALISMSTALFLPFILDYPFNYFYLTIAGSILLVLMIEKSARD